MLKYTIAIPTPSAADVVARRLAVTAQIGTSAAAHHVEELDLAQLTYVVECEQDTYITLELTDVDDAGNVSEASKLQFVAEDTIAPPAPGTLAVASVEEVFPEDTQDMPAVTSPIAVEEPAPVDAEPAPVDAEPAPVDAEPAVVEDMPPVVDPNPAKD
jgi:hypothetical protein